MADDTSATPAAPVAQTEQPDTATAPSTSDAPAPDVATESTEAQPAGQEATQESADAGPIPQTNGASSAKKEKRKSTGGGGGVPEHKNKKLNRKQSKIDLNLDIKPGELWLAVMKGYKNWPCIICDEEMLPESLLSKRPVSAMRPDGSYRPDFDAGGKNARDRRYPIMFLGTNEFAWHVNTDLRTITVEDCKKTLEENAKKPLQPKTLWNAFEVAAEGHDLAYFKQMLADHEEQAILAQQEYEEEQRKQAEAAAQKTEDVEMADANGDAKPKKEKKRKAPKDEELGEDGKPLKTPKKIKIKPPQEKETPVANGESTKKEKKKKAKEEKSTAAAETPKPSVEETPEEAHEKMQKTILFLRHRLQKGFLSRDKPPEESEMPGMHQHMKTLENYHDLEGSIIKSTKINKVLKAIIKLGAIPREQEFQFKKRSQDILTSWAKQLNEDIATPAAAATPTANGAKEDDKEKPAESDAAPGTVETTTEAPKTEETPAEAPAAAPSAAAEEEKKKTEEPVVATATTEPTTA